MLRLGLSLCEQLVSADPAEDTQFGLANMIASGRFAWSSKTGLIDVNGDAEMWLRLCNLGNRPVVRVADGGIWTASTDPGDLNLTKYRLYWGADPNGADSYGAHPVLDHLGNLQNGLTCENSVSDLCLKPSDPTQLQYRHQRACRPIRSSGRTHSLLSGRVRPGEPQAGDRPRYGRQHRRPEVGGPRRHQRRAGGLPLPERDRERSETAAAALHPVQPDRKGTMTPDLATSAPAGAPTTALPRRLARAPGDADRAGDHRRCSVLRYLLPSPLAGASGGLAGFLSWIGDHYPLFAGLALFLALSEVGRYWANQLGRGALDAVPAAPAFSARSPRRFWPAWLAVALVAFVTRSSLVATFRIVGPSMLPTLEIGDRVLVNRLAYGLALPFSKPGSARSCPSAVTWSSSAPRGTRAPTDRSRWSSGSSPFQAIAFPMSKAFFASMIGACRPATPAPTWRWTVG